MANRLHDPDVGVVQDAIATLPDDIMRLRRHSTWSKWCWSKEIDAAYQTVIQETHLLQEPVNLIQGRQEISKTCFRTVRKAKRTFWEFFLQQGNEEVVCKAISGLNVIFISPLPH